MAIKGPLSWVRRYQLWESVGLGVSDSCPGDAHGARYPAARRTRDAVSLRPNGRADASRTHSHTYTGDDLEALTHTKAHRPIMVDRGRTRQQVRLLNWGR